MKNYILLVIALSLLILPNTSDAARSNLVTTGLSVAYDYDDRQYDPIPLGERTSENSVSVPDDDYRNIIVSPRIHFMTTGQTDSYEISFEPALNYDTIESESNWDLNALIGANKQINPVWRVFASNSLLRSDYYESSNIAATDSTEPVAAIPTATNPDLSANFGRNRYWRNSLLLGSEHQYSQESLITFGFDYILLRNDESDFRTYNDYDRYAGSITNEHFFNHQWNLLTDLTVVRGEFETVGPLSLLLENNQISDDLMEYYLSSTLEHNYNRQNSIALYYEYIGTRYDEDSQVDGDIHQLQLSWTYLLSRRSTFTLGVGPSYEKSEGQDSNTGGNGIVQYDYLGQYTTISAGVEKRYGVDNFSGTSQRGFIDYWDTFITAGYQLTQSLNLDGELRYRNEDREDPVSLATNNLESTEVASSEEYNTEIYLCGVGLRYDFLRYYSTRLLYTFTKQESERLGDTYDDHRIFLALSWEQDWLRW